MTDHRAVARSRPGLPRPGRVVMTTRALDGGALAELANEPADTGPAHGKPMVIDQVLPDRHRIAPAAERLDDQLAIRLAGTGAGRTAGRGPRPGGVGGHLGGNGRFSLLFPWSPTAADCDPRRAQNTNRPSHGGCRSPAQCVRATSRGVPTRSLAAACSDPDVPHGDGGTRGASPRSTSRPTASGNGRF